MKNYIVFLSYIILLYFQPMSAQNLNGYGIKFGYTNANSKFKNTLMDNDFDRIGGFSVAVYVDFSINNIFYINTQLEYLQKGFTFETARITVDEIEPQKTTLDFRLEYLHVPLLAKINLPIKKISPYFMVGPGVNYLLRNDPDMEGLFKDFEKIIFDLSIGVGFQPSISDDIDLLLEFRYDLDLSNSYDKINELTDKQVTIKNRSFTISLGLYFNND